MSNWEVVLLDQGRPGRVLQPPEVPVDFVVVPNPGDIIAVDQKSTAWKVMRIEHGETAAKLDPAVRAQLELIGKGMPLVKAHLAPRPTCRIFVREAHVWSEATGKQMLLGLQWPDRVQHNEAHPYDQSWGPG